MASDVTIRTVVIVNSSFLSLVASFTDESVALVVALPTAVKFGVTRMTIVELVAIRCQ